MADNFFKIYNGTQYVPQSADPTNPVEGDVQFADGTVRPKGLWEFKDGDWVQASGGGGGLDSFHQQDFESLATADFTSGLNAVYKTAGSFGGTLSDETTNPIAGTASPKYEAGATSTNDWFDVELLTLDIKQKDTTVGVVFYADTSSFTTDAEFVVWDETNSAKLDTTGFNVIEASTGLTRYSFAVTTLASTDEISYGFHMVTAPVNGESFIFDDVEFTTDPFVFKNLIDLQEITLGDANGHGSSSTAIRRFTTTVRSVGPNLLADSGDSATLGREFTALRRCKVTVAYTDYEVAGPEQFGISLDSSQLTTAITAITKTDIRAVSTSQTNTPTVASWSGIMEIGQVLRPHTQAQASATAAAHFSITAIAETEHVITPSESGTESFSIHTHAGYGSTNTKIPRLTTITKDTTGKFISVNNSLTLGLEITALTSCIVSMDYSWDGATGTNNVGISLESSQLTTNITAINADDRKAISREEANGGSATVSVHIAMDPGEVLRPHSDGVAGGDTAFSVINVIAHPSLATFLSAVPVQESALIDHNSGVDYAEDIAGTTGFKVRAIVSIQGVAPSWISIDTVLDRVTLESGVYFWASQIAGRGNGGGVDAKLRNITDSVDVNAQNTVSTTDSNDGAGTFVWNTYRSTFTITKTTTFEIQTRNSTGVGGAREGIAGTKIIKQR